MENLTSPVIFCDDNLHYECADQKLILCASCSAPWFITFSVFISILATLVLVGNALVIASVIAKPAILTSALDYIKASLATADMLSGLQLIIIAIPNVIWSMNSTPEEIDIEYNNRYFSVKAFVAGCFYMLTITAPLFNLTLLSYTFFSVIKWPFKARTQGKKEVIIKVTTVWTVSIVAASYAAWFPQVFQCAYIPPVFLYLPNIAQRTPSDVGVLAVSFVILSLSYFSMTTFNLLSSYLIWKARRNRRHVTQAATVAQCLHKRDTLVLKNLLLMDFGYSATLSPIFVWFGLYYTGNTTPDSLLICIYLKMFNSLVNVLIYSTRDKEFRKFIASICGRNERDSPQTSL